MTFIKTDNNEIVYTAKANSAKVSENKIVFSNNTLYKNFANDSLKTKSEIFTIPIQSKVALKNINHLGIKNIYSYQKFFSESILENDVLFKAHLDKVAPLDSNNWHEISEINVVEGQLILSVNEKEVSLLNKNQFVGYIQNNNSINEVILLAFSPLS